MSSTAAAAPRTPDAELPRVAARGVPDAAGFAALLEAGEPVVIRGAFEHWPALSAGRASPAAMNAYLKSLDNGVPAPVIEARPSTRGHFTYLPDLGDFNFAQRERRISDALDHIERLIGDAAAPFIAIQSLPLPVHLPGFLAANPAPLVAPHVAPRIWIGGRVRTQTHHDPDHNLACVLAGRRRFLLFPPEQVSNLYIGPIDQRYPPPLSLVDPDAPDFERFPRFRRAIGTARVAFLEPGDALFIPRYWWHHVTSLESYNVLVNYWWGNEARGLENPHDCFLTALLALRELPEHERGYWREMFEAHVFRRDNDAATHIPAARRGLLAELSPATRARLRQQLKLTYLKY